MAEFSHFNDSGRAWMVDVSEKSETARTAVAAGRVKVNAETFALIKSGGMKKGDVLGTAQIAGIMGAKRTPDIIPMCHPIMLSGVNIDFALNEEELCVEICATAKCTGVTGVEMEALTAVSVAALTVYDMCKAVQKDMEISDIRLLKKSGGKSGDFVNKQK
ncbi:MAG: cyclic pyranopterin monophosphate synthase MoaC [Oscillospiraceae bacterium]|nr:cyclic pyranopterin monophosphate synthase MoaC [Oscillospiraceae bacterium]